MRIRGQVRKGRICIVVVRFSYYRGCERVGRIGLYYIYFTTLVYIPLISSRK